MADSNTVVTTQSYFSRIGGSIKGIGIGIILFIVGFRRRFRSVEAFPEASGAEFAAFEGGECHVFPAAEMRRLALEQEFRPVLSREMAEDAGIRSELHDREGVERLRCRDEIGVSQKPVGASAGIEEEQFLTVQ